MMMCFGNPVSGNSANHKSLKYGKKSKLKAICLGTTNTVSILSEVLTESCAENSLYKRRYQSLPSIQLEHKWFNINSLETFPSHPRTQHAAVAIRGKMWIVGGKSAGGFLKDAVELNTENMAWTETNRRYSSTISMDDNPRYTEVSAPRCAGQSLGVWKNQLVMFGGRSMQKPSNELEVYLMDMTTMKWMMVLRKIEKVIPEGRSGQSVVQIGSFMVMFGGENREGELLNDLWVLNLETLLWIPIKIEGGKPCARKSHVAGSHGGRFMWIVGGKAQSRYLNDVYRLDLQNMQWTTVETTGEIPTPRAGHAGLIVNDTFYVIGGENRELHGAMNTAALNVKTLEWSSVADPRDNCSLAHDGLSVVRIHSQGKDYLMTFGGHANQTLSTRMYAMLLPSSDSNELLEMEIKLPTIADKASLLAPVKRSVTGKDAGVIPSEILSTSTSFESGLHGSRSSSHSGSRPQNMHSRSRSVSATLSAESAEESHHQTARSSTDSNASECDVEKSLITDSDYRLAQLNDPNIGGNPGRWLSLQSTTKNQLWNSTSKPVNSAWSEISRQQSSRTSVDSAVTVNWDTREFDSQTQFISINPYESCLEEPRESLSYPQIFRRPETIEPEANNTVLQTLGTLGAKHQRDHGLNRSNPERDSQREKRLTDAMDKLLLPRDRLSRRRKSVQEMLTRGPRESISHQPVEKLKERGRRWSTTADHEDRSDEFHVLTVAIKDSISSLRDRRLSDVDDRLGDDNRCRNRTSLHDMKQKVRSDVVSSGKRNAINLYEELQQAVRDLPRDVYHDSKVDAIVKNMDDVARKLGETMQFFQEIEERSQEMALAQMASLQVPVNSFIPAFNIHDSQVLPDEPTQGLTTVHSLQSRRKFLEICQADPSTCSSFVSIDPYSSVLHAYRQNGQHAPELDRKRQPPNLGTRSDTALDHNINEMLYLQRVKEVENKFSMALSGHIGVVSKLEECLKENQQLALGLTEDGKPAGCQKDGDMLNNLGRPDS